MQSQYEAELRKLEQAVIQLTYKLNNAIQELAAAQQALLSVTQAGS